MHQLFDLKTNFIRILQQNLLYLKMKKDIHPQMQPVIFRDAMAKKDFIIWSTATSEEKETVDGVEYNVVRLDVSSASHPFYTGKQNLIDTSGRIDKFKAKMAKVEAPK